MKNIRIENWKGYNVRFVKIDDEWWAVLNDLCKIFDFYEDFVTRDLLDQNSINKVEIGNEWLVVVNELGIYDLMYESRCLDARKFKRWSSTIIKRLRKKEGLSQYEVLRMMDQDIQDDIDHVLDTLFYDEETGKLMQSVTVQGGDVEQVEF